MIHETAIVSKKAKIAKNVTIAAFVVIEDDVEIAEGCQILAGSILQNGCRIGKNCYIGPYASLGGEPMDSHFNGEKSFLVIEDNVQIRDFASIHRASGEAQSTIIGENSMIMSYAHISHNCKIGKNVNIVTGVRMGGHVEVDDFAFISSNTNIHQFCRIGKYALTSAQTGVNRDVLPFSMVFGHQGKHYRLNRVGLERRGINGERYKILEKAIRAFRRKNWSLLAELATKSEDVKYMLEFKENSNRGLLAFV